MSTRDDRQLGDPARPGRPRPPSSTPPGSQPSPTPSPSDGTEQPVAAGRGAAALKATRAVGRGVGRATLGGARLTARGGRYATDRFRRYAASGGADRTGLARVTELHASHTAGDAAMMLALAGTLFLNPQTVQARGQVALFLLLTMVPFALVAPLIGPVLDRFSHGRRWAIGTTMAARAFLCWVLAEAIYNESSWLFPAALGCLVASRAYNIARAAAVPRLLPAGTTLVNANSKVSVAGVVGAVLGGALAGAAMRFGSPWALRVAFVIFVAGTVQAIRLPDRVDSATGELSPEQTTLIPQSGAAAPAAHPPRTAGRRRAAVSPVDDRAALQVDAAGPVERLRRRVRAIPWPVRHALWSTGGTRLLTGFLIMFMAFLAKEHPIDGVRGELVLGLVVVGIGIGNALGSVLGNVLKDHRPERVAMVSVLLATATCVATALWYGVATLIAIGLVQGLSAQLAKLCLDALVQRDVAENVRASVFAWAETMLQVLWVVGGALGIVLPLNPYIGFPVCAAALVGTVVMAARTHHGVPGRPPAPRTRPAQ